MVSICTWTSQRLQCHPQQPLSRKFERQPAGRADVSFFWAEAGGPKMSRPPISRFGRRLGVVGAVEGSHIINFQLSWWLPAIRFLSFLGAFSWFSGWISEFSPLKVRHFQRGIWEQPSVAEPSGPKRKHPVHLLKGA